MSKLLEEGIRAVRQLPEDRQEMAGALLLSIAAHERPAYRLTPEQIEGIRQAKAEVARGEFASESAVEAVFGRRFR
ncbi:MAG TPA: hypothetical protein VHG92_11080 [Afifellaceae bacterium]|nr:hypothetical protein [Afifellaceae bacterium]